MFEDKVFLEVKNLMSLIMINCEISCANLVKIFKDSKNIMNICLNNTPIRDEGLKVILMYSKNWKNLCELDLNTTSLTGASGNIIAQIMENCEELKILAIMENDKIGEEIEHIFKAVGNTKSKLMQLAVTKCGFTGKSLKVLCESLKLNNKLRHLAINENDLGLEGALCVRQILEMSNIMQLIYMSKAKIGDEGAEEVAEGLKKNTSLETLGIGSNNLRERGGKAITNALKVNKSLTILYLKGSKFNELVIRGFVEALKIRENCLSLLGLNGCRIKTNCSRVLWELLQNFEVNQTKMYLYGNKIDKSLITYADALNPQRMLMNDGIKQKLLLQHE